MSQVNLEDIIQILNEYTGKTKKPLELILIGGLALQYYGMKERATIDIDAEIKGDLEGLFNFLKENSIPSDLGEDIAGWSVVSMPPGYRERAIEIYTATNLSVKVLNPLDFIIAKLRRATEEDMSDAIFVAKKFGLRPEDIKNCAEEAVRNSPKDTMVFLFRKNVELFLKGLQ